MEFAAAQAISNSGMSAAQQRARALVFILPPCIGWKIVGRDLHIEIGT
jgi:hypothetical protein